MLSPFAVTVKPRDRSGIAGRFYVGPLEYLTFCFVMAYDCGFCFELVLPFCHPLQGFAALVSFLVLNVRQKEGNSPEDDPGDVAPST